MIALPRWLFAGLVATALSSVVHDADACPGILETWVVPDQGATIPANAPALVWFGSGTSKPLLETAAGVEVPFTIEGSLLRPTSPLGAGTQYRVTFAKPYDGGTTVQTFTTSADAPLPVRLGTLSVSASQRRKLFVESGASCVNEIDAAVVAVALTPSPELEPWRALIAYTATVDGVPYATPRPGRMSAPTPAPSVYRSTRGADQIYARCASAYQGTDPGVAPGRHTLTITASVPGAATLIQPVSVDFTLDCDGEDTAGACAFAQQQLAAHAPLALVAVVLAGLTVRRRVRS